MTRATMADGPKTTAVDQRGDERRLRLPLGPTGRRFHDVLGDERGVALVMALGMMMVLAIMLAATLELSSAGARHASLSNSRQEAHALAEAGLSNVVSQLASRYPSASSEGNGGGTSVAGSQPVGSSTVAWTATFDPVTFSWALHSAAALGNPTGGSDVVGNVEAKIGVGPDTGFSKFGLFSGDPTEDVTITGGTNVNVPVYVAGNLDLGGNTGGAPAKIWEPNSPATVTVEVGGQLSAGSVGVGTSASPVKSVAAGSCSPAPCGPSSNVYALAYPTFTSTGMPAVNAQTVYESANWSSSGGNPVTCATGTNPFDNDGTRNNSRGTVSFVTLASYDCTARHATTGAVVGHLVWNTSTKHMTIDGKIFFDGDLSSGPHDVMQYSGNGTIYANGTVTLSGKICGPGSTFNLAAETCSMQWDPTLGTLLVVASNGAGPLIAGPPVVTGFDPDEDGVSEWTKSPAGAPNAYSLLVNSAAPAADGRVTSATVGQRQDVGFGSQTYAAGTYTLWVHAGTAGTVKRVIQYATSVDNGASYGSSNTLVAANTAEGWFSTTVSITSQAQLDQFRVRLTLAQTGGGHSGTGVINAVFLQASIPTYTNSLATPGFSLASQAKFEAGAWSVGDFTSTGQTELGGSVFIERGSANIAGGGTLKAFISLPSGAPSAYTLADSISDYED
jgi:hypothetical protein